tara:strand:+ start:477 stop:746 length:270 start_codon:yes stop_codon:yes gene_type:complete
MQMLSMKETPASNQNRSRWGLTFLRLRFDLFLFAMTSPLSEDPGQDPQGGGEAHQQQHEARTDVIVDRWGHGRCDLLRHALSCLLMERT